MPKLTCTTRPKKRSPSPATSAKSPRHAGPSLIVVAGVALVGGAGAEAGRGGCGGRVEGPAVVGGTVPVLAVVADSAIIAPGSGSVEQAETTMANSAAHTQWLALFRSDLPQED
ncbi:MAG: hypothetical protein ACE5E8_06340 [Acidimicrobiia bacterium]